MDDIIIPQTPHSDGPIKPKFFDRDGQPIQRWQLKNKGAWYEHGHTKDEAFVRTYGEAFGIKLNPNKEGDPVTPGLVYQGHLATLRCQNMPLFRAQRDFGIPPRYAVKFHLRDALRYGPLGENYKDLSIWFWVDWAVAKMVTVTEYTVAPLCGVWRVDYARLEELRKDSPILWYKQGIRRPETNAFRQALTEKFEPRLREGDNVWSVYESNKYASCSYVLNLQDFEQIAKEVD
jgi:hypothetical protein